MLTNVVLASIMAGAVISLLYAIRVDDLAPGAPAGLRGAAEQTTLRLRNARHYPPAGRLTPASIDFSRTVDLARIGTDADAG